MKGNWFSRQTRRIAISVAALSAACLSLYAAGAGAAPPASLEGVPTFGHVFVIMGENTELGQINQKDAPYLMGTLRPEMAWLTNYFALTHFSEANYVGMMAGGFTRCQQFDGSAASCHQDIENLFHQLDGQAITWQSWMESMPDACFLTSTGSAKDQNHYGAKHNPAIFFDDIEGVGGVWSATDRSAELVNS